MADYALKQLHVKRAAVFYYPDKMYAQAWPNISAVPLLPAAVTCPSIFP